MIATDDGVVRAVAWAVTGVVGPPWAWDPGQGRADPAHAKTNGDGAPFWGREKAAAEIPRHMGPILVELKGRYSVE